MSLAAQQEAPAGERRDLSLELHALVAGCGAYRLDRALVSVSGKDRVRWLNGMVSNNIRDLAAGHGVYTFVLNPQGHIQGDLYAFNRGETITLEVERTQTTLVSQLRRYIIMDKVEVEELGDRISVFGIAGPSCDQVLSSLGTAFADSTPLAVLELPWRDATLTIVRGDNPSFQSYEFWVPSANATEFRSALLQNGAREVGAIGMEAFRILCGIPKIGTDIRERSLPQETAQERALSFTKGCYIGQEIVERIRARGAVHRTLTGFEITGPCPPPATPIRLDGKEVGLITSIATIPVRSVDHAIALGFLRREQLSENAVFDAGEAKARLVSLPFSGLIKQL